MKQIKELIESSGVSKENLDNIDLFIYYTDFMSQDKITKSFALLGVGGVGSNFAEVIDNILINDRYTVVPFDDDKVEIHNLNRTKLFAFDDAIMDRYKINALYRRLGERLVTDSHSYRKITKNINNNAQNMVSFDIVKSDTKLFNKRQQTIFDCRDVLNSDFVIPGSFVKLSYNGASKISFHFKPEEILDNVINISNTYEVTPSFAVPPKLLSIFAMYLSSFTIFGNNKTLKAGYVELNIDDFINENSFLINYDDTSSITESIIEDLWFEDDFNADKESIERLNLELLEELVHD